MSATNFLCVKTFSGNCKAYLIVHKWLVGDIPLNINFVHKVNHPLATVGVQVTSHLHHNDYNAV